MERPAPHEYLDAGPKIIEWERPDTGQMCQVWDYEGRIYPYIGLNAVAGKKPEEYGIEPVRYDDMIPGCYDPKARVADMDIDGVQAMTCFPSFPRFAGAVFFEGEDKELARLCSAAWNDFHLDEWAATRRTGSFRWRCCRSGTSMPASRKSTALPPRAPSA